MSDTTHAISQKPVRRRQTMKAFVVSRYGKANSVEAVELPEPELGDGDVLVQIHAASVNPLDLKIRNGELKALLPYKLPLVLGNDLAGVVIKAGANVDRFKPGDEVYAKPDKDRIGAFAELIAISENDVAKKPHATGHGTSSFDTSRRADRMASADRKSEAATRSESTHPRRFRRSWNDRDSTRKASRGHRRHHHEHRER